ncbi:MAG TPA: tetratricopeptide repeat protein [Pyrinomonadaceae bacterium]|nr:tetratricopeptide repeat protein [Pyrinomonadaceae bacterium]
MRTLLLFALMLCLATMPASAQAPATVIWQVNSFDVNANVQQTERLLNGVATINATNIGSGSGRTLTLRINSKASVKSVTVGGAAVSYRPGQEPRGDLQRVEITLPAGVAPNGTVSATVTYSLPVESNSGLTAISPIATQFLPLAFWYPMPNTPYSVRGADTAPFHLTVNIPNAISSGVEKAGSAGSVTFDQSLYGQPFFLQGDWDKLEGAADAKGVIVMLEKGAGADDRKHAEALMAFTAAARAFFAAALGPAPDATLRLVAVRRGAGFTDAGTVLFDADTLRLPKLDAATALTVAETVARLWIGGQTPVRGEGAGVLRDALVRFLATQFLEKQFGADAVKSELYRQRLAYATVAQRDGPLARTSQLDSTYFASVPNRGAMFWRLIDRRLGREELRGVLRAALQAGKSDPNGFNLVSVREALVARGGESLKALMDQELDQVVDTDLMVGLPVQRGADWVSALRNLGSIDVTVTVAATTEQGQELRAEATVPAKNFGEAVFKTSSKIVRVEVDPDKLYPQLDYGNDVMPRGKDLSQALNEASLQLGAQDFAKAEATARAMLAIAPRFQEAQIILARALLGQNRVEDAERLFRAALEEPLPFAATVAWANIGLGEIAMKRNQAAEAVKRFNDAVVASRDYPSSLAARAARIRAEAAANSAPPVDENARTFITQLSQAVVSNKKAELESRIIPGELVRFINGSIGTEAWETKVVRTEQVNANLIAADVQIRASKLGTVGTGTAVLMLARTPSGWKLSGIELFEVR